MARKMLIDATHPEETRVAVIDGSRLEEFDAETSIKKQLKGSIYLAKVIRIEPSLQAAFVDFGHERHGFLPFSEIHPDYYRIPVADRQALAAEMRRAAGEQTSVPDALHEAIPEENLPAITLLPPESSEDIKMTEESISPEGSPPSEELERLDQSEEEEIQAAHSVSYRYKIQEVIKRRQILLVQVVKEERGNKGAALTTYLSLPGRYCVLMPNAGRRGGGISRKISDANDRRRLREILQHLQIPEEMGIIVRTAGQERSKAEIKRDFEYLLRLWSDIREKTLQSIAPALIYAESDLIKRSIRDIYNRTIDQILVEGESAYKEAKAFMRTLIPSHAKRVKLYKDQSIPLFHRYQVEKKINLMMYPSVPLPSGGSIVINITEALVAIDVNSGKATRERHIDDTALKTNLEAADEIALQMRLRDLAGLIVIDFIDMNDHMHVQTVERKFREAVKLDRARTQLGRISQFGLLELSRQRLRPSLIETHTTPCPNCHGVGLVRSVESTALHILRAIVEQGINGRSSEIVVTVPAGIDLYLLNQKRQSLIAIEQRFSMKVIINRDDSLRAPDHIIESIVECNPVTKKNTLPLNPFPLPQADTNPSEEKEEIIEAPTFKNKNQKRRRNRQRSRLNQKHPISAPGILEQASVDTTFSLTPHQAVEVSIKSDIPLTNEKDAGEATVTDNRNKRQRRRPRRNNRNQPRRNTSETNKASQEGSSPSSPIISKAPDPLKEDSSMSSPILFPNKRNRIIKENTLKDEAPPLKPKKESKGWWQRLLE